MYFPANKTSILYDNHFDFEFLQLINTLSPENADMVKPVHI